ncbi:MAG: NAD(+) kinase [Thermoplasmata archaeon]|nr:NAD(+) kinase [Thermoplasmata archaeon]
MKIGLVASVESKKCIHAAKEILDFFKRRKTNLILEDKIAHSLGQKGLPLEKMKADIAITIGGDGTILRTLRATKSKILGINAGVLGFLTELKVQEIESGLEKLLKRDYTVEKRSKLKVVVGRKRLSDCANEAVIHTAHVSKIRHFGIQIDGQVANDIRADGIIISTSTGSTCYAMSVGGPIIDPKVDAMVIAPIAPFKLAARPMVVPAKSRIRIDVIKSGACVLVLDGQEEVGLKGNESVNLSLSENKAEFIRFGESFYKRLREKLGG